MKKAFFVFLTVISIGITGFAQTNPAKPRLAVAAFTPNFNSETTKADIITVRELAEVGMQKTGKYSMVSRNEIDTLLDNQNIALTEISSAENVQKLQLTNVRYIVTGTVNVDGPNYIITVKILDVRNGEFAHSDYAQIAQSNLFSGVNSLVAQFIAGMTTDGGQVVQVFKIGDFGPAGGIVFYDKGTFSNGWRYFEAAPSETEFYAVWGAYQKDVSGTSVAVGSGKRNTQIIIDRLRQLSENGRAAQLCTTLDFDGFEDWFLPSMDELNLMYTNLRAKGLGGFENNWYWSSSEFNSDYAFVQYFGNGKQDFDFSKNAGYCVRAVRSF